MVSHPIQFRYKEPHGVVIYFKMVCAHGRDTPQCTCLGTTSKEPGGTFKDGSMYGHMGATAAVLFRGFFSSNIDIILVVVFIC